jgi:hypothetical protein
LEHADEFVKLRAVFHANRLKLPEWFRNVLDVDVAEDDKQLFVTGESRTCFKLAPVAIKIARCQEERENAATAYGGTETLNPVRRRLNIPIRFEDPDARFLRAGSQFRGEHFVILRVRKKNAMRTKLSIVIRQGCQLKEPVSSLEDMVFFNEVWLTLGVRSCEIGREPLQNFLCPIRLNL